MSRSLSAVLLVERDAALALVLARRLGQSRLVIQANRVERALALLEKQPQIGAVVSSYKFADGTAGKLFALAQRRWPTVRRVLYCEAGSASSVAVRLAHVVVDTAAPIEALLDALG